MHIGMTMTSLMLPIGHTLKMSNVKMTTMMTMGRPPGHTGEHDTIVNDTITMTMGWPSGHAHKDKGQCQ